MMHGKKTVVVLIILFALVCSVSAAGTGNQVTDEILIQDCNTRPEYAPPAYGDVCQGETDYHIYTPGNEQILEVSLKWDHTSGNDLDLYIKPPESDSIRFHDQDDGKIDIKGEAENVEDVYSFFKNMKDSLIDTKLRIHKLQMKTDSVDDAVILNHGGPVNYEFEITNMSAGDLNTPQANDQNQQNQQNQNPADGNKQ